jgi:opacity protein-like surface antigen
MLRLFLSILLLGCVADSVLAAFAVKTFDPGFEDYGNAQSGPFRRAISPGPMTQAEKAELSALIPEPMTTRFYMRVRANTSTLTFDQGKNNSKNVFAPGVLVRKRASKNQYGLEFAVGYAWSTTMRGDAEYLVNNSLTYTANPGLSGNVPTNKVSADIKNNTLLFNGYYEFGEIARFKPYLTAGLGLAYVSVKSVLTPVPNGFTPAGPRTARKLNLAYQLGMGMRLGLFSDWFLDASYRFVKLGNNVNINPVQPYQIKGTYFMNAISLGVLYAF